MLALSCKVSPLYDVPCVAEVNFQRERRIKKVKEAQSQWDGDKHARWKQLIIAPLEGCFELALAIDRSTCPS
jgi:hypothetical protein